MRGEELESCSVRVFYVAACGCLFRAGSSFFLHLAGLEVFSLDSLCVTAAQGAHGRQRFSALTRLEKTQKKLSRI